MKKTINTVLLSIVLLCAPNIHLENFSFIDIQIGNCTQHAHKAESTEKINSLLELLEFLENNREATPQISSNQKAKTKQKS